jgi:3-hydroxyisobutyrate dehydrogenase-like beta-hydroxyacid dehydrogenase
MTDTATTLGFIGLGVMGEPICRNIATKSKLRTLACDMNDAPLRRLAADGVVAAADIGEIAREADTIFLSLPGGPEVEEVVAGSGGLLAQARQGQTIVDLSTTPVALTRRLAGLAAALGVSYADAPVARTRAAAVAGTLSIMVGAPPALFAQLHPLLAHAASEVTHCGEVGCGQVVKIMNNMILAQTVIALSEALAIGKAADIDGRVLFETLSKGSADSFALRNHGMKAILPEDFPKPAFSTAYMIKDLDCALALAAECSVTARGAALARGLLAEVRDAGYGEDYWPVVSRFIGRVAR